MEKLQETLIEAALYLGYCMGERGEVMLGDSREVVGVLCERAAEFEGRWEAGDGGAGGD